ncbi:MAG: hypothetical protein VXZ71_11415 [SAR324 cluster bacterium]|nr:hypothetical protein [SAR324 cluster bacterium]
MTPCQTLKLCFPFFLLWGFMIIPLRAETYSDQLQDGLKLIYRHWNSERKEFTGFTHQEFLRAVHKGSQTTLETQINIKSDGEETRRKSLWYEYPSGKPIEYLEEDLREDLHIVNLYEGNKILTTLRQDEKTVEFEMELKEEPAVSFELLLPFLRKNLEQIRTSENYLFTLYLPALAIELENSALPRSMSLIQMRIRALDAVTWESELGDRKAVWLEIFPESMMLRALLPKKKSHFRFLLELESPRHILQFEEGGNVYTLTTLESRS